MLLNRSEPTDFFVNVEYDLVRAYFEANGFWLKEIEISSEVSRKKLIFPYFEIFNASNYTSDREGSFRLFTGDLSRLQSAIVSLLGWQNTGFSADMLTSDARIMKFFRKQIDSQHANWNEDERSFIFNDKQLILIVPALPKSETKSLELFDLLRKHGVQGVLTMSSVLENLLRKTSEIPEIRTNSTFHLLKLLKVYGLATEPQLDIFDS